MDFEGSLVVISVFDEGAQTTYSYLRILGSRLVSEKAWNFGKENFPEKFWDLKKKKFSRNFQTIKFSKKNRGTRKEKPLISK